MFVLGYCYILYMNLNEIGSVSLIRGRILFSIGSEKVVSPKWHHSTICNYEGTWWKWYTLWLKSMQCIPDNFILTHQDTLLLVFPPSCSSVSRACCHSSWALWPAALAVTKISPGPHRAQMALSAWLVTTRRLLQQAAWWTVGLWRRTRCTERTHGRRRSSRMSQLLSGPLPGKTVVAGGMEEVMRMRWWFSKPMIFSPIDTE